LQSSVILTTEESESYETMPFSRDRLFTSIYDCCKHRPTAIDDASELTRTIISKLLKDTQGAAISKDSVRAISYTVLKHFDKFAANYYLAYYHDK
jgi:transcriptional regulator NrdR family protein